MDLIVEPGREGQRHAHGHNHWHALWGTRSFRAAVGRSGLTPADTKREGDGASPIGRWAIRSVLYRPDRVAALQTALPVRALGPTDGWCDAPADPAYNRPVTLPYPASAEALWRDDGVYDLICTLAHNDAPPVPGAGSAIFLHVARDDFTPTEGCAALALPDLLAVLAEARPGDGLVFRV